MENKYEFLLEKDALWADICMQVLRENGIPCEAFPVNGAGMVIRGGMQERLRIFVPAEKLQEAATLMEDLFAPEETQAEK